MARRLISRQLYLPALLEKKSIFLFGPRGTGKSHAINHQFSRYARPKVYDLLSNETFARLSRRPSIIFEEIVEKGQLVVIDEVQKLPELLDEVHRAIERKSARFLLTGSSARKLRRGSANLLAGRAWQAQLFPFVSAELGEISLEKQLLYGSLPLIHHSTEPAEELRAYVGMYLKEEILAEALIRRLEPFVSFLTLAATKSGEELNYASLASDIGIPARSVQNYFDLLEDTLIGFRLPAFRSSVQRKAISRSKFYFFDLGVTNELSERRSIPRNSDIYGRCFEQFIILELRAYLSYRRKRERLTYWRTKSGYEVDCIVGQELAIEIKSSNLVNERHLANLRALRDEGKIRKYCIVSQDPEERAVDGVAVYPWKLFLKKLWDDSLI